MASRYCTQYVVHGCCTYFEEDVSAVTPPSVVRMKQNCRLILDFSFLSGWYDGSEWFKPPDIRARDEMLNNYEVQPAVERLKV